MGGCYRFLQRVWTIIQEHIGARAQNKSVEESEELLCYTHRAIKSVSVDIGELGFNTAISSLMEFVNNLYKLKTSLPVGSTAWDEALLTLVKLLALFVMNWPGASVD